MSGIKDKSLFGDKLSFIQRTSWFKKAVKMTFDVCDADKTGQINKAELYAGVLLVHLKLAKYAGAAACFPPTREVVDKLFEASDDDNSGTIDEREFGQIMVVCSGQISSRVGLYLLFVLFLVPTSANFIWSMVVYLFGSKAWAVSLYRLVQDPIEKLPWLDSLIDWDDIAEDLIGAVLFLGAITVLFNTIDKMSQHAAEIKVFDEVPTETPAAEKKND